jgi:hypothetical protein
MRVLTSTSVHHSREAAADGPRIKKNRAPQPSKPEEPLLREYHERPLRRVERLATQGRREGALRSDLPAGWLVATFYSVLHGAAGEITAGRRSGRQPYDQRYAAGHLHPARPVPHARRTE